MHYLVKKKQQEVRVGDKGICVADFSGVDAGTKFIVTEIYESGKGITIAWQGEKHKIPFRNEQLHDGFSSADLIFLAFEGFPEDLKNEFLKSL